MDFALERVLELTVGVLNRGSSPLLKEDPESAIIIGDGALLAAD